MQNTALELVGFASIFVFFPTNCFVFFHLAVHNACQALIYLKGKLNNNLVRAIEHVLQFPLGFATANGSPQRIFLFFRFTHKFG